jgi:hypothetical protein
MALSARTAAAVICAFGREGRDHLEAAIIRSEPKALRFLEGEQSGVSFAEGLLFCS